MKTIHSITLIGCIIAGPSLQGASNGSAPAWRNEVQPAIERSLRFLEKEQKTNGAWAPLDQPAITALALAACMQEPSGRIRTQPPHFVARGYDYLVSTANERGTFGTNYITYNTALSLIALQAANRPRYQPIIQQGRRFLAEQQADFAEKGKADNSLDGGIGYGDGSGKVNLANTHAALEALYWTGTSGGGRKVDLAGLDQTQMRDFIRRCQNILLFNRETWANEDKGNRGGFIYYPGKSFAGETTIKGKTAYISYGSMTSAGLASYMYLGMPRGSHEVFMAGQWLGKNFTVNENPKMGQDGLYYYYMTLSKALSLYGDPIKNAKGERIDWREEIARRLLALQKSDGSWVNGSDRWKEAEPVLATSYAIITLNTIARPSSTAVAYANQ